MVGLPSSAAALLASAVSLMIISGLLLYVMIGEANRKLPDSEQIPYPFMYPGKVGRVKRELRRLYPNSKLPLVRVGLNVLSAVLIVICATRVGFFR